MPVSAVSVRVTCARGQSVCLCVYDRVTRRTVPHCFFVSPFFVWSLRLSSVYYLVSVCVSEGSLKGPGVDDYFPDLYGSLICCVEAFALNARNQIAARAISERTVRKSMPWLLGTVLARIYSPDVESWSPAASRHSCT